MKKIDHTFFVRTLKATLVEAFQFACSKIPLSPSTSKQHGLKLLGSLGPFGPQALETIQDFLIKLDIKSQMHLLKISNFSRNNDMNNLVKDLKILSFKVIFQGLKLVKSFQKKFCEEHLIRRPTFNIEIF